MKRGKVYLVGAGPGDPSLITVKGLKYIEKAEVVVYDYLANKKLLNHAPKDAEFIYAGKKGGGHHAHTQEEINNILIDKAKSGKMVVRLKGGDPFIFGRGGEEIEELALAGIPFEVVPGVTSATAAATYAGVPITHRRFTSTVAFVTGHEDPTKESSKIEWQKIATGIGTLVFYMGIKNLPLIAEKLIANGRDPETPAMVVRWASTPEQRSVDGTLATIGEIVRQADIKPPALVVIGDVVTLRKTINWFETKPLYGKRIMVTRTREQASDLVAGLEEMGANCIEFATISIAPPDSWEILDAALADLGRFDWILFTSINAIHCFFKRLDEKGLDSRALGGTRIAAVGSTTAEVLRDYGIKTDLLPEKFTGDALAAALLKKGVQGSRILLPRATKARETLPDRLQEAGAEVVVAPVYKNVRPDGQAEELRSLFLERQVDMVTFTSSSTVTNFLHMLDVTDQEKRKALLEDIKIASIGPITSKTVEEEGLAVHVQPETFTIPSLIDSIVAFYKEPLAKGTSAPIG